MTTFPAHTLRPVEDFLEGIEAIGENAAAMARVIIERNRPIIHAHLTEIISREIQTNPVWHITRQGPRNVEIAKMIADILEAERQRAMDFFKKTRENGQANDPNCYEPGVGIYFVKSEKDPLVLTEGSVEIMQDVRLKDLPNGTYETTSGIIRLYPEPGHVRDSIKLPQDMIIRIEGRRAKLWQNPNFNWNLKRK